MNYEKRLENYYQSEDWDNQVEVIYKASNLIMKKKGYHSTIKKSDTDIVLRAYNLVAGIIFVLGDEYDVRKDTG